MDLLTHTLSGIAVGTVIASFSGKEIKEKLKVIGFSGIGGAFPDIDTISLWSGFDGTLRKILGLANPGKTIYFSKFWYSHHGFFHSIFAGLLLAFLIGLLYYLIQRVYNKSKKMNLKDSLKSNLLLMVGFVSGFIMHLFADMPTPGSVWGGVRLFWPLNSYVGGTGDIWWWNNYDIFLIVIGVIFLNGSILLMDRIFRNGIKKMTIGVFLIGLVFSIYQIKNRKFDFNYTGFTQKFEEYEKKSKEIQKQMLGNRLYNAMNKFDKKIVINF